MDSFSNVTFFFARKSKGGKWENMSIMFAMQDPIGAPSETCLFHE